MGGRKGAFVGFRRRFRLKVTGKGVGGTQVAKCNVNLMKKWSEICSGCTRMLSAVQSRV